MKQTVRRVSRVVYRRIAKPLMFRVQPDDVHRTISSLGRVIQTIPLINKLPSVWRHDNDRVLRQTVFGLSFRGPVGLSAGFDKNIRLAPLIKSVGFNFMTGGSITAIASDGNPKPWFYRLPRSRSLVVNAGLPNAGVAEIAKTLSSYPRALFADFPLVVSVAKTNAEFTADEEIGIDDYCATLAKLEECWPVSMYELNISCPNAYGGEPFTTPARLEALLTRIDELHLTRPITVKMPISLDWPEFRALLDVIMSHQVQGVTIGNLLKNRDKAALRDELPSTVQGNLSGVPTRAISTALIRQTYQHCRGALVIIGVGGIFSADDAYEKIRAGATLVELITGMIFEGPQLIGDIHEGLVELLQRDGYTHVSQAIGVDAR